MVDVTRLNESSSSAEESRQDVLENTFFQKHKELSVLLLEMKEAQEEIWGMVKHLSQCQTNGCHTAKMKQCSVISSKCLKKKMFCREIGEVEGNLLR